MAHAPTPLHAEWDGFIDALDRAGQSGSAQGLEIPSALANGAIRIGAHQHRQVRRSGRTLEALRDTHCDAVVTRILPAQLGIDLIRAARTTLPPAIGRTCTPNAPRPCTYISTSSAT